MSTFVKPYDVLIIAPPSVREWVHNDLVNLFESWGLQCCLEERDFKIGASKPDQWCEKIQLSRKILLLLTSDFNSNSWHIFASEIAVAQQVEINTPLDPKVIPVKLHYDAYVPKYIAMGREILERSTELNRKYFLTKLKRSLKQNESAINSQSLHPNEPEASRPSEHSQRPPTQNDEGESVSSRSAHRSQNYRYPSNESLNPESTVGLSDTIKSQNLAMLCPKAEYDVNGSAALHTKYTFSYSVETPNESMHVNVSSGGTNIRSFVQSTPENGTPETSLHMRQANTPVSLTSSSTNMVPKRFPSIAEEIQAEESMQQSIIHDYDEYQTPVGSHGGNTDWFWMALAVAVGWVMNRLFTS